MPRISISFVAKLIMRNECSDNGVEIQNNGNGPVNAIDSALRQALIDFYPTLKDLTLTDYKVMILSSDKGTGAITRVHIESTDDSKQHWTTVGVSSNIIDASYNAIYDSITFKLFNDLNK